MTETRIVNEATGGEKCRKPQRMELLPWAELMQVAELYAAGASKYADHNWRKGFDWSLSFGAMLRHAALFWDGEEIDSETECPHLASVIFHALALLHFCEHHRSLDDRPSTAMLRDGVERQEAARAVQEAGGPTPDPRLDPSLRPFPITQEWIDGYEHAVAGVVAERLARAFGA